MIKNIDARRKIVPGNKYVADNDQNVEWDTKSFQDVIEDIVMDDKMYKIIRKHATVCDHKSRRKRKRLFFAFIRCAKEKELAERAGCTPENIRKYLARMFTCIVRRLAKDNQEEIVKLTPTGYKRKWIHGTP
ncbi:hypothetical protein Dole_2907 [Desulfosudis oleivorans Hxd3]|uniref:Uncharacterized protein n=2 Tax=Desulfosudis TaxID=2904716 RepID=A8ZYI5_DESOH|nr:hypothetical protein Dole_2907 [Desulfosudis oleivorans Hxd3]